MIFASTTAKKTNLALKQRIGHFCVMGVFGFFGAYQELLINIF